MSGCDPRRRTLEALEQLAHEYGVAGEVQALQTAEAWLPGAVAALAEFVSALALQSAVASASDDGRRRPRRRRKLERRPCSEC